MGQNHWVSSLTLGSVVDVTGESPDVQQYLLTAVTNSNHGWDYVLQGLVKFAFYLLEGFVPKALESPFGDAGSAMQQLSDTGTKLLVSIYEVGHSPPS